MGLKECKIKCNERVDCLAFEYGVSYGGRGDYHPEDCLLQSGTNKDGCDGTYYNLDLYVKKGKFFLKFFMYIYSIWNRNSKSIGKYFL